MKKNIPAVVLAIACIALLIAYTNSSKTIHQLREEIARLQTEDRPAIPIQSEKKSLTEGTGTLAQVEGKVPADENIAEDDESGRRMMKSIAMMMENPTMNKVMEASQRGAIGALYTDLIDYLNLDQDEQEYFMDLLMYRQMKQMDLAMKMMSGELADEEQQTLKDEAAAAAETVKTEMENFLNNSEDYEEWQFYEKTMGERMMLSQMDQDLAASDSSLSDETYRDLLGMMHEEKENFEFTSDLSDQENMDLSAERFSKENVQNLADDMQQLNDLLISKAQDLLTPEQLAVFIKSLQATTDMQLAQIEMAAQMFGGNNGGAEDQ